MQIFFSLSKVVTFGDNIKKISNNYNIDTENGTNRLFYWQLPFRVNRYNF